MCKINLFGNKEKYYYYYYY